MAGAQKDLPLQVHPALARSAPTPRSAGLSSCVRHKRSPWSRFKLSN